MLPHKGASFSQSPCHGRTLLEIMQIVSNLLKTADAPERVLEIHNLGAQKLVISGEALILLRHKHGVNGK